MARTLVGRLQLVVEAMGLGEAKKVEGAMSSIERAAKRLSAEPWGQNFHRQIEKMALDAGKLDQVRRSWDNLQKDMSSRGLTAALKKSEIAAWKTATVGHFAAVQAQAKRANEQMDRTVGLMRRLGRVGLAAGGIYGGVYGASMVGREAFRAASEGQRTKYRFQVAGISKADTDALDAESTRLAGKYGVISKNDILELGKTSYALFGGRTDLAKQVLEAVVQNFVADFTSSGEEFAGNNMSSFLKAMDNLNKNEGADGGVGNIAAILNGWTKAKQVEGKDIEIGEILSFAQRAKVAKYALDNNFLSNILPALGQDMGFGPLGDALSGIYQNLVTPSGGGTQGQYVKRQQAMGLRDDNNSLIQRDRFAANPYDWTIGVLKPLLEKNGVDTSNPAATAEAVKKLMSNSKAAAAIVGWIASQPQIDKNVANYQNAAGLSDAQNVRAKDPMAAWRDLKSSLEDLSNAAGETVLPVIVPALNGFANTIRSFAEAVGAGDPKVMGAAGVLGAGIAGLAAWKTVAGIYGLITAGASLQTAATMLEAAAIAQGGGVPPGGGTKPGAGSAGWLSALGLTGTTGLWALLVSGLGDTPGGTFDQQVENQKQARLGLRRMLGLGSGNPTHFQEHERDDSLYGKMFPSPQRQGGIASVGNDFEQMLSDMDKVNSTTVSPTIDVSQLRAAKALIDGILNGLGSIGGAMTRANSIVDAQVRRAHADFGVAP